MSTIQCRCEYRRPRIPESLTKIPMSCIAVFLSAHYNRYGCRTR